MKQNYDFEPYKVEEYLDLIEKGVITLPIFQRDLVWSDEQKRDLSSSLKRGLPFGIFLLAKSNSFTSDGANLKLLDGFQRTNAIMEIYNSPQAFFDKSQIDVDILCELEELLVTNGAEIPEPKKGEIADRIVSWIKDQKDLDTTKNFTGMYLFRDLATQFFLEEDQINQLLFAGYELLSPIISEIDMERQNIGEIEIPCIIYKGEDENLPEIFEKLNTQGTKLTKYQIFAAHWSDYELSANIQRDIKEVMYEKYLERQTEGNIIIDDLPSRENYLSGQINLFEYLFGLGNVIEKEFPLLFFGKGDSIGFTLSAACLRGSVKRIIDIQSAFENGFEFQKFRNALFNSIAIVNDQLLSILSLKINKYKTNREPKQIIYHSDYQIISFIAKLFRDKYSLDTFDVLQTWEDKKAWVKNIQYYYLYDKIERNWRGSGDSRIEDMLTTTTYENVLTKEIWRNSLERWFREYQITRKQTQRSSIDNTDLLFLNYIYKHLITFDDLTNPDKKFHLEHIIPVKLLKDYISENLDNVIISEGLPISSVANLCYLDATINNSKGEKTIYQYAKEKPEEFNLAKVEEKFTFTSEKDLALIDSLDEDPSSEWRDEYFEYLENRFNILVEKFLDMNDIPE
jgi:hypothetical protein